MMNKNVKIAKELVKLAKLLIGNSEYKLPSLPIKLKALNENEAEDLRNYLCENNKYVAVGYGDNDRMRYPNPLQEGTLFMCENREKDIMKMYGNPLLFDFERAWTIKCEKNSHGDNSYHPIHFWEQPEDDEEKPSENAYWDLAEIKENSYPYNN